MVSHCTKPLSVTLQVTVYCRLVWPAALLTQKSHDYGGVHHLEYPALKGYALILSHFTVVNPRTFSNSSAGNVSSSSVTDCAVLFDKYMANEE